MLSRVKSDPSNRRMETNTFANDVLLISLVFPPAASGQHCDLRVCDHRGRDVVLHGGQEAPEGLPGGAAVTGGQTQPGGAEPAAGQSRTNLVIVGVVVLLSCRLLQFCRKDVSQCP